MRGLLLFLLGCLVGANATYFLMSDRSPEPVVSATTGTVTGQYPDALPPAGNKPSHIERNEAEPDPADSTQHDTGPILPPPLPAMRGSAPNSATTPAAAGSGLLIPVQGVTASQLSDTFTDARSAGRSHDAIDIMAPTGTPVIAVADGHVEKLFTRKLGGLTLYQFNRDGTLAYYYAHLQRYADGLSEQQVIRRGQVIGYVGYSGNASPEGPHLHFAIFVLGPEKQWWQGEAINPYPQLGGAPH
ncbi:MAG: M23 family metallopeptidase [Thermomonas sp.]